MGCVHLAGTVLPATLWTAAVISRWCARMHMHAVHAGTQCMHAVHVMAYVNMLVFFYNLLLCASLTSSASHYTLGR